MRSAVDGIKRREFLKGSAVLAGAAAASGFSEVRPAMAALTQKPVAIRSRTESSKA